MDEQRPGLELPVRPVSGPETGRTPVVLVAVVAVVVALALIKPWGPVREPVQPALTPSGRPTPAAPPTAAPTPDSYADLVVICGSPSGWRAATVQHWVGRASSIRAWFAIAPVPATSALDPAIPFAPVATDLVRAIGYCAPRRPEETPKDTTPEFWAIVGTRAQRVEPERLEPAEPHALGGLWRPPPGSETRVDGIVGWAPGRYAIRVGFGATGRWLGVEIEELAPSPPAALPSPPGPTSLRLPSVRGAAGS